VVTDVTVSSPAIVTTDVAHGYISNQIIRLLIPKEYGMNINASGAITVINSTSFSIDIDTSNQYPFVTPTAVPNTQSAFTDAQAIPDSGTWNNIGAP
jgi:hypothetical protein